MSLYQVQKFLFHTNRDLKLQAAYKADPGAVLQTYALTPEENLALRETDVRALYVMGADGLLILPFAQMNGLTIADYKSRLAGLD